ncbi:MAG TPA: hypothetical protein VMV25_02540 [Steroidobacteraceae bacterium]|nr:hypothetical protein [Steroidobacteraceae bacterium]
MEFVTLARIAVCSLGLALIALGACSSSGYALRAVPRIVADDVGMPVDRLQHTFGAPRRIDRTATSLVYFWFIAQVPAGAPAGFHGCDLEVAVDARTRRVLGYSLANVGWSRCRDIKRRIRVAAR